MDPDEYGDMVKAVNDAMAAMGVPCYTPSEKEAKSLVFRRSIFASADIKKGENFTKENIRIVRPSNGAKPKYYEELLSRSSDRDYCFGDPIVYGD